MGEDGRALKPELPIRILLVEDNPADAYLTRETLLESKISYEIQHLRDGEEAIRFLEKPPEGMPDPELIILDLNLPKIEGGDVLIAIQQNERFREIPVMVLTSSDSPQDRRHAAQFGARVYVRKPSNLEAFMDIGEQIRALALSRRGAASSVRAS